MVDRTDKFKPRQARPPGDPSLKPGSPPLPPAPPPLWFGLVVGGFIGVIGTTSLAVGMYWLGILDVNLDALLPTEEPVVEITETTDPLLETEGTPPPLSVIIQTSTPTETETPSPTPDWGATATDACGAFMDEFPGTPCPSPNSP